MKSAAATSPLIPAMSPSANARPVEQPPLPTSAPATRPSVGDAEAVAAIHKLLDGGSLRLSTDSRSAAERFSFVTELVVPMPLGGQHRIDYWIVRDKERMAILVTTKDGLPYCYLTDGLLVMFDPTLPGQGQLMVYEGGAPSFTLEAEEDRTKLNFLLTYSRHTEKSVIRLDIASLLEGALNRLTQARLDAQRQLVAMRTEHGLVSVLLPTAGKPSSFPIQGLMFAGGKGSDIIVSDISANTKPAPALFGITRASVERLNLPLRILGDREVTSFQLIVPPTFPANAKERAAAEALLGLLGGNAGPHGPASRPAVPAPPSPAPVRVRPRPGFQQVRLQSVIAPEPLAMESRHE